MAVLLAGALFMQTLSSDGAPEILDVAPEIEEQVVVPAPVLTPRSYLYSTYPALARRFDCVIYKESGWDPTQQNRRSGAAGLTQILYSTWMSTPQGQRGESRFNAFSNLDGAAWLVTSGGGWRHWAATVGGC